MRKGERERRGKGGRGEGDRERERGNERDAMKEEGDRVKERGRERGKEGGGWWITDTTALSVCTTPARV